MHWKLWRAEPSIMGQLSSRAKLSGARLKEFYSIHIYIYMCVWVHACVCGGGGAHVWFFAGYGWRQLLNKYYSHFISVLKVFTEKV